MLTFHVGQHYPEAPEAADLIFAITEVKHAVHVFDFRASALNRRPPHHSRIAWKSGDICRCAELTVFFPTLIA